MANATCGEQARDERKIGRVAASCFHRKRVLRSARARFQQPELVIEQRGVHISVWTNPDSEVSPADPEQGCAASSITSQAWKCFIDCDSRVQNSENRIVVSDVDP